MEIYHCNPLVTGQGFLKPNHHFKVFKGSPTNHQKQCLQLKSETFLNCICNRNDNFKQMNNKTQSYILIKKAYEYAKIKQ